MRGQRWRPSEAERKKDRENQLASLRRQYRTRYVSMDEVRAARQIGNGLELTE